jgi:hypothetical protein
MTNRDKLKYIEEHFEANPETCYFAWDGIHPVDVNFYKINMVFAYVIGMHNDTIIARKIAGTSFRKNRNKKIIFSTDLWRATNKRTKRKRVITPDQVHIDEDVCPAGLIKNVEEGSLPYQLTMTRSGDTSLLDILYNMVKAEDKVLTDKILRPICYLCAYEPEVYKPKPHAELMNTLKTNELYDASASLEDNFNRCFTTSFMQMSNGRWLVNHDWVSGKGIPYIDLNSMYNVYSFNSKIEDLDYEDDNFIFKISGSLRW